MKFLGVIPARGGSKGVPRKNIRPVAGKPLLAWTIEHARAARGLDAFVVSTDDDEVADVARAHGAAVLARPPELARDETPMNDVLRHVLRERPAESLVLLQPTSPVRAPGLIDDCIAAYERAGADTLATGFYCRWYEFGATTARRQDLPGWFYDDGNVYIWRRDLVERNVKVGERPVRFEIDKAQRVDVDDPFDLWLAERVLEALADGTLPREVAAP